MRTTVENIYCAGEQTGIGGVDLSLREGEIAGLAASGAKVKAVALGARLQRERRFIGLLRECFALQPELKTLADDETVFCRCEDIVYRRVKGYPTAREAKIYTRCGMGPCQGRVCGAAGKELFGWEPNTVRPPVVATAVRDLILTDHPPQQD